MLSERLRHNLLAILARERIELATLAKACDIDPATLYRFRDGEVQSLQFKTIERIARYLKVDPARLFEPTWNPPEPWRLELLLQANEVAEPEGKVLLATAKALTKTPA